MDDYDDGDYLDMDNDWIYVEDEFDLADELAENAIPEPGYMGTAAEIAMESYNFDFYSYNEDLEYGEDAYWDSAGPIPTRTTVKQQISQDVKTGSKRKRKVAARTTSSKQQKLTPAIAREAQPVLFRRRELVAEQRELSVVAEELTPFALLPDWKERFKNEDGVVEKKHMPAAMVKAADDAESDDAAGFGNADQEQADGEIAADAEEDDWESQDGEADDEEAHGLDVDPEQLKAIIAAKLAEAGISGDEEKAFLQSITGMLSGDGKGEAAAALLEKAAQSSSTGRKRKADSVIGLEPEQKKRAKNGGNGN